MDEQRVDRVEDAGFTAIEVGLGFVPFIGPPLATITGKYAASVQQKRLDRILAGLQAAIDAAQVAGLLGDYETLSKSEVFMANFYRAFRASTETSHEAKRERLRVALVRSGTDMSAELDYFNELVARYDETTVRVLGIMARILPAGKTLEQHARNQIREHLMDEVLYEAVGPALDGLVADGLVSLANIDYAEEQDVSRNPRHSSMKSVVQHRPHHATSELGERFLAFISTPMPSSADRPPSAGS